MENEPDKVNSGALAVMVVLTALGTLGVALTVTALVRAEQGAVAAEREASADRSYRDMRAEQEGELNSPPSWADRAKGLISVPIDRAMEFMLADIRRGKTTVGIDEQGLGGAGGASAVEEAPAMDEQAPSVPSGAPAGPAPQAPAPAPQAPAPH